MIDPAILDALVASGCTAEQIASAVKAAMASTEKATEERKAKDRARKRKPSAIQPIPQDSKEIHGIERNGAESTEVVGTDDVVSLSPVPLLSPHTPLITPLPPNPSQKQNSRGTRLPDDWQLTGPDLAYALSKGLTEQEAGDLGERMKSWALSAGGSNAIKRNWHQAYQGWVQREAAGIIKARAGPSAKPLTRHQQDQDKLKDIRNGLQNFADRSSRSGEQDSWLLPDHSGERSGELRDGSGSIVDGLPNLRRITGH